MDSTPIKFSGCKEFQIHERLDHEGRFFRLRAPMNVMKPLQRIVRVQTPQGELRSGLVKYERLGIFCFNCGHNGHRFRQCSLPLVDPIDPKNYRSVLGWLVLMGYDQCK